MTDGMKLVLWSSIGVISCGILIPTITEAGGIQTYINFAAFLAIYSGGTATIATLLWLKKRGRQTSASSLTRDLITASQVMVLFLFGFGLYWYDFSVPRPHPIGADYIYSYRPPSNNNDGIHVSSLHEEGLNKDAIGNIVERFVNDPEYKWQHSFLLFHNNKLVVEEYFYDQAGMTPHDLRSANKSITSILIGIAIQQGYIKSEKDKIAPYFPEYREIFDRSPGKAAITIEHLLTMQSGLDANDWQKSSPGNENRIYRTKADWIKEFLSLDLLTEPGTQFSYSTLGEMTLRRLIVNASGMPLDLFAEKYLFRPLKIETYQWTHRLPAHKDVPYRVQLTSRDFAKLGLLYLNKGHWQGTQIVSPEWVTRSTAKHTTTTERRLGYPAYGYLWWRHDFVVGEKIIQGFQAQGNGGQFLFVFPELQAVAVFTSRNFGRRRQINPLTIMKKEIVPLLSRLAK